MTPTNNPISIKLILGGAGNQDAPSESPESSLAEEGESSLEEIQSAAEEDQVQLQSQSAKDPLNQASAEIVYIEQAEV